MDGLPFLPGNTFRDPTKTKYHVSHSLNYKNGYRVPQPYPQIGIGGDQLIYGGGLTESELDELANFQPTLTYGQARQAPPQAFVPAHVAFDKKVLRFYGYFKETVTESPAEYYRIRHVVLYYYLEDDSIAIIEPPQENSGIPQGKFIKRQRLPKNDVGDNWSWKDINNGMDFCVYGRVFRITSCDAYTKKFLESEGIVVREFEMLPRDPYLCKRSELATLKTSTTPSDFDKTKQFLEMDRKVLRFFILWDDSDSLFGEVRPFVLHYYLVDDTMEVREVHQSNDGRDPFPVLIRRDKIPKQRDIVPSTFPSIVMELSAHELGGGSKSGYFGPADFKLGATLVINGRRFLFYDCDNFTKAWYYKTFGVTDFTPVPVDSKGNKLSTFEIPPYNGWGSLEDSLQSCLSLVPEPPKKDYIKMIENDLKLLRYEAYLDSIRAEDKGRRFIISYRLADDMITIFEPATRNSGLPGGTFLKRSRVCKPESTDDKPVYYGTDDFYIGARILVFGTKFIITGADKYVLNYMEAHPTQFPPSVIESIRQKLQELDDSCGGKRNTCKSESNILRLMYDIKSQLKRMAITDKRRIDEMFLKHNPDRRGYIDVTRLQAMCRKMQLPDDEVVLSALLNEYGTDGKMNLEEFRSFFEN